MRSNKRKNNRQTNLFGWLVVIERRYGEAVSIEMKRSGVEMVASKRENLTIELVFVEDKEPTFTS